MERIKSVAATYTWTFVVVMVLNQLLFFGFCLNPVCLIAAMPHVLLITVALGTWFRKIKNRKKDNPVEAASTSAIRQQDNPTLPETGHKIASVKPLIIGKHKPASHEDEPTSPEVPIVKRVKNALDMATAGIEKFDKKLDVYNIAIKAWSVYNTEKGFIKTYFKVAEMELEVRQKRNNNPEYGKIYDELLANWGQDEDEKNSVVDPDPEVREVANFILPTNYEDLKNIDETKAKVAIIALEHFKFLEETKCKLDCDPALMAIFEEEMEKSGGGKILAHIKSIQSESRNTRKSIVIIKPKKPRLIIATDPSKRAQQKECLPTGRHLQPIEKRPRHAIKLDRYQPKPKASASLFGPKAHILNGNWSGGFACDIHTLRSRHLGVDENGHDRWDNTRSEMGQLIYRLKYSNDISTIPQIIERLSEQVTIKGFDCIVPVPASKNRRLQPVDAIAGALGEQCHIPVIAGFLGKTGSTELKGMDDPMQRANTLRASIKVIGQEDISNQKVLLLDDLYRSGATLNACCQVLREDARVGEIWVLTMTKTRRNK